MRCAPSGQAGAEDDRTINCTGVRVSGAGILPWLNQAMSDAAMFCPKSEMPHWTELSGG